MKTATAKPVSSLTAMPACDFVIEEVSFRLAPVNGLALLHLACGQRTFESTDVELRYCPRCKRFLDQDHFQGQA